MGISQANFKSGPFALTVSWLLDSYVSQKAHSAEGPGSAPWPEAAGTSAGARGATYFGTARW